MPCFLSCLPSSPNTGFARAAVFLLIAGALAGIASAQAEKPARTSAHPIQNTRQKLRADVALLHARVDAALTGAHARQASWGILVVDRDSGEILYESNADRFFVPASNTKLFTSAAALALLGQDYRFRTTLESKGSLGAGGRLTGDLILVGRGDPDLSNRKFPYSGRVEHDGPTEKALAELADAAVAGGLKFVDGGVLADDSYYPYDPVPAGWPFGDLYFTFGAPVSAIAFNDNSLSLEVRPGEKAGDPAVITIDPIAARETIVNSITTRPAGGKPDLGVTHPANSSFLYLFGTIPLAHEPAKLDLSMPDPALAAANALKQLLEARGVLISGKAQALHGVPAVTCQVIDAPELLPSCLVPPLPNPTVLAERVSPPLLESVRVMNKISHNLHAELFLRAIAREKKGLGANDPGLWAEQDFWKAAGLPEGDVLLADGSGLSGDNLVTPRAVVALLRYAAAQPWGADFISTLPIAGIDGTLEERMRGTPAAGRIQAKTGGLEHVHALSGFATTLSGEPLIFSILENNAGARGHDSTAAIDAIGIAMVETLGAPHPKKKK